MRGRRPRGCWSAQSTAARRPGAAQAGEKTKSDFTYYHKMQLKNATMTRPLPFAPVTHRSASGSIPRLPVCCRPDNFHDTFLYRVREFSSESLIVISRFSRSDFFINNAFLDSTRWGSLIRLQFLKNQNSWFHALQSAGFLYIKYWPIVTWPRIHIFNPWPPILNVSY